MPAVEGRDRLRPWLVPVLATGVLGWGAVNWSPAARAADQPLPRAATHLGWNGLDPILSASSGSTAGANGIRNPSNPVCTTPPASGSNVNTDCEGNAPHNETSIAVNPADPWNLIGAANDYQLNATTGGAVYETIYTRAHVSSDGGSTWTSVSLKMNAYSATGDPAVAFDADGRAYLATLGFGFGQGNGCCRNPDIIIATSGDKGQTWSAETRVASGSGVFGGAGVFNDKEYIAAWGHGNAIVTWTVFNQGPHGAYISSPIFDSVTHDGGGTWSAPQSISGSAPFCIGALGSGTTCDGNQFSTPVVGSDGSIHVSFENTYNLDPNSLAFNRDQYLVVAVDPATGAALGPPSRVAQLVDGSYDYPINVDGRQTLQDSEFRTNSSGDITVDPTNPAHLAVIWSDMRNSTLPATPADFNPDPFAGPTNSDVVVSQSTNGGVTWSAPVALRLRGDQFQPWGAYDASGRLRVGYYDRSADPANHLYTYSLATESKAGSLNFSTRTLSTVASDPTSEDRWFSGGVPNHATTFLGDYSNIAATASGGVAALWTDLRNTACFTVRCGHGEDAMFAAAS